MFQLPAVILSILIASILAVLFYIWQGKTLRNLVAYWIAGLAGFFAGQLLGILAGARLFMLGQIHLLEGAALCLGALFVVKLLKL